MAGQESLPVSCEKNRDISSWGSRARHTAGLCSCVIPTVPWPPSMSHRGRLVPQIAICRRSEAIVNRSGPPQFSRGIGDWISRGAGVGRYWTGSSPSDAGGCPWSACRALCKSSWCAADGRTEKRSWCSEATCTVSTFFVSPPPIPVDHPILAWRQSQFTLRSPGRSCTFFWTAPSRAWQAPLRSRDPVRFRPNLRAPSRIQEARATCWGLGLWRPVLGWGSRKQWRLLFQRFFPPLACSPSPKCCAATLCSITSRDLRFGKARLRVLGQAASAPSPVSCCYCLLLACFLRRVLCRQQLRLVGVKVNSSILLRAACRS